MSRLEDRYWEGILWIAKNAHGGVVAGLAAFSYFGVGLGLPIIFKWDTPWLVNANVYGTLFAVSLIIAWLVVQLKARDRRLLLEWTSDLRQLDPQEFEWLVGEVYRREGWEVDEHGRQDTADGNIDLIVTRGKERRLVQCKRWTTMLVGIDTVRGFVGTLTKEGLAASAGTFVTLSRFTEPAIAEAKANGLQLVDGTDLLTRIEAARTAEPCDTCHKPMILDHSVHGWWLRCVTPDCGGKRHLDRDPGRAVAMLLEQHG